MNKFQIDTPNTKKIMNELKRYYSGQVMVRDIKELASHPKYSNLASYLGVLFHKEGGLVVYVTSEYAEAEIIHELLHEILRYEGFPQIRVNKIMNQKNPPDRQAATQNIRNRFQSTIDHFVIYRRMQERFDLDFDKYFSMLYQVKLNRFRKRKNKILDHDREVFRDQQDILEGLDFFFYAEPYKHMIMHHFRKNFRKACSSCNILFKNISKIGFITPEINRKSAHKILKHIIRFGEKAFIDKSINRIWKVLVIE